MYKSHSDADSEPDAYRHSYRDSYTYCDGNFDTYRDSNGFAHSDRHCHGITQCDLHRYSYGYANRHSCSVTQHFDQSTSAHGR